MFLAARSSCRQLKKLLEKEENLRVVELKFKTGMAIQIEVLQARQKLAQAQSNLTDVQKNYALATASMKAAKEGLVILADEASDGKTALASFVDRCVNN